MTTMTKTNTAEQQEAIDRLRQWIKPGDTVHCILRHVSKSGMFRVIDLVHITQDGAIKALGYNAAKTLGDKYDPEREGIRISGAGMDMGFALVYNLGSTLWPDGYDCIGEGCHANDHANGDRDYTPGHARHRDGGYALRHRWL